jgi:hypothetical protein
MANYFEGYAAEFLASRDPVLEVALSGWFLPFDERQVPCVDERRGIGRGKGGIPLAERERSGEAIQEQRAARGIECIVEGCPRCSASRSISGTGVAVVASMAGRVPA